MRNPTHTSTANAAARRARRPAAHVGRRARALSADASPFAEGSPLPTALWGVVVDAETGAPVAGACLVAADPLERLIPPRPTQAAAGLDGRFRLDRPRGGAAVLVARGDGYLPELVLVGAGEERVTVALARGGALRGTVTRRGGGPVAGARVRAVSREAMDLAEAVTDGDGRFALPALRPGRYQVEADGAPTVEVQVRTGDDAAVALLALDA